MYTFQHNDKQDIAGLLDMVRRGCERFYRIGMSDRPGLAKARKFAKLTNSQKDEATLLAMDGKMDIEAIAYAIGHNSQAVARMFQRNGITYKKRVRGRDKKRRSQ